MLCQSLSKNTITILKNHIEKHAIRLRPDNHGFKRISNRYTEHFVSKINPDFDPWVAIRACMHNTRVF